MVAWKQISNQILLLATLLSPMQAFQGTPVLCELGLISCQINGVADSNIVTCVCCAVSLHDGDIQGVVSCTHRDSPPGSNPNGCFCHRACQPQHIEQRVIECLATDAVFAEPMTPRKTVSVSSYTPSNICTSPRPKTARQTCADLSRFLA